MTTEGRGKERPQTSVKFHYSSCVERLKNTKIGGLWLRIELESFGMEIEMVALSLGSLCAVCVCRVVCCSATIKSPIFVPLNTSILDNLL
jgi:hypothetical protein